MNLYKNSWTFKIYIRVQAHDIILIRTQAGQT
jgi:hypothetical protein